MNVAQSRSRRRSAARRLRDLLWGAALRFRHSGMAPTTDA